MEVWKPYASRCKLPGGVSISHDTPNECFVEGQFYVSP
jgi:hypothetical protein